MAWQSGINDRLKHNSPSHLDRLLEEGRTLLGEERNREAALVFSRLLREVPDHPEARHGKRQAETLIAEQDRLARTQLEEARSALARGDAQAAQVLLQDALARGADRDAALPLLDRLDGRVGRLSESQPASAVPVALASPVPARAAGWSRLATIGIWLLALALFGGTVAASFDRIVRGLAQAPRPRSRPATSLATVPPSTLGQSALAEARRLAASGDARGALQALDSIPPRDPAYPLARRIRSEAERGLFDGVAR
jgi:hypothetical protein